MQGSQRALALLLASVVVVAALVGVRAWKRVPRWRDHPVALPSGSARLPPEPLKVPTAPAARLEVGRELYVKYCALCHGGDAKGYAADNAPSLVSESFLTSAQDSFIARAIRTGRPGTAMGGYGRYRAGPLDETQINAIIAWLRSHTSARPVPLPPQPIAGDAARGEALYGARCQMCHGTKTTRASAVHLANPEFRASASDAFLRYALVHGRQGTPMVARPGGIDDAQIDDLLAFLRTWLPPAPPKPDPLPIKPPPDIPKDLPIILNPGGARPNFTLKDGRYVSAAQVKAALEHKQRLVILDARTPGDWVDLRIPGALPMPYHDMGRADDLPKDGTWIVAYCACPHHASGAVVDELRKRNFPATAVLDEGILWWRTQGFPIEGATAAAGSAAPLLPLPHPP